MILQEKIFSKEECERIISYHKTYTKTTGFYPNDGTLKENNRFEQKNGFSKYHTYVILNELETSWFFDKLLNWFSEKSNIKLNKKVSYCSLHGYKIGDGFKKHIDLSNTNQERRYNLGIQLNEDYSGGEYVCWDGNGNENLISKEQGTALAYHCRVPHEIKEITSGERWSIVMPISKFEIVEKTSII